MVNNKLKIISSFIFVISFFFINSKSSKRKLDYVYENGISILIEERDNSFEITYHFYVEGNEGFPAFGSKKADIEESKNLTIIFDEIFKNTDMERIERSNNDLTPRQNEMILKILDHHDIIYQLRYEIIHDSNNYNKTFKQRGFSFEYNDGCIFTIAMGEMPTGGYSINIKKTKIKRFNIDIYVSEKAPGEGEIVAQSKTYPIVQIKLNAFPKFIKVYNYDTNEIYPYLDRENEK
jgi:hypothetical protein